MALYDELKHNIKGTVLLDEAMCNYTTWKIGGKADCLVLPSCGEDIKVARQYAKDNKLSFMILGNGSNILVLDGGIDGVVVMIRDKMDNYSLEGTTIISEAGVVLARLARESAKAGLRGLEWAAGIPSSIGGAAIMNAGAYGHNFYEVLKWVEILDNDNNFKRLEKEQLSYEYRHTSLMDSGVVVLRVAIELTLDDADALVCELDSTLKLRRKNQPLEYPSCGSVFKNPKEDHAGRLVEACGLRGLKEGGVMVSEKHGNFIVNVDNGTANDVLNLIDRVKGIVLDKFNIDLSLEVKIIGRK